MIVLVQRQLLTFLLRVEHLLHSHKNPNLDCWHPHKGADHGHKHMYNPSMQTKTDASQELTGWLPVSLKFCERPPLKGRKQSADKGTQQTIPSYTGMCTHTGLIRELSLTSDKQGRECSSQVECWL